MKDSHAKPFLALFVAAMLGTAAVAKEGDAPATQPSAAVPATPAAAPTAPAAARPTFKGEESAVALADKMIAALGGSEAWEKLPYLVFTFTVEKSGSVVASRKHFWDKRAGRHRLEGATKDGKKYVVLTDLSQHKGTAYLAGTKLEGEEAQKYLEAAYGAWVNDTYWLAMPFKVKDPGVILSAEPAEEIGGTKYLKLKLRFDGVGLTPRDVYWAYVDPATSRMERWAFVLNGGNDVPTVAEWKGWRQHGGVWLSDEKVIVATGQRILFPDLTAPPTLPDAVFTSPEGLLPGEVPPEPKS